MAKTMPTLYVRTDCNNFYQKIDYELRWYNGKNSMGKLPDMWQQNS